MNGDYERPLEASAVQRVPEIEQLGDRGNGNFPRTQGNPATSGVAPELPALPRIKVPRPAAQLDSEPQNDNMRAAFSPLSLGPSKRPLPRAIIVAYGTGHVLNDLTAACWFTYLLIFLTDIGLSPQQAATVMMSGQLADAGATLLVGRLIDTFGHFKLFHASGSVIVALSFASVFGGCFVCSIIGSDSAQVQTISYSVFAAVFNVGWAATQVSHMALVNCITLNPTSRVALNSSRNAFTMASSLSLYAIAFLSFSLLPCSTAAQIQAQFQAIAAATIGLGCCLILVFYFGVKEPRIIRRTPSQVSFQKSPPSSLPSPAALLRRLSFSTQPSSSPLCPPSSSSSSLPSPATSLRFWLTVPLYYQVAAIYTLTRLITNVTQAILPFFLMDDLNMHPSAKAVIPAVVFIFSFLTSLVLQEMSWSPTRLQLAYSLGSALWALCSLAFFFLQSDHVRLIFLLAAVMGLANALLLVSATSMVAALVGQRLSDCAIVYGSLSFLDKLTCGVALYAIGAMKTHEPFCGPLLPPSCPRSTIRWLLTVLPLVASLLGVVVCQGTRFEHEHVHRQSVPANDVMAADAPCSSRVTNGASMSDPLLSPRAKLLVVQEGEEEELPPAGVHLA